MSIDAEQLIWIDLEMTGLDPGRDRILEIATLVTDKDLAVVATGPELAIHQPDEALAGMDAWNVEHHTRSGLVERVRASTVTERAAEEATLDFLREHVPAKISPMCGNSICQDRRFLVRYMPDLEAYFHYRHVDVSTFKELALRWAPEVARSLRKESAHRALADIEESVAELRHYRALLFRP
ncbi:MAG: oligoribonuclease, partial [Gammaproteobacteria bacterium]